MTILWLAVWLPVCGALRMGTTGTPAWHGASLAERRARALTRARALLGQKAGALAASAWIANGVWITISRGALRRRRRRSGRGCLTTTLTTNTLGALL
jgi:hypothetical protein